MKKTLTIMFSIAATLIIVGLGVVKFYIEPNLSFILTDLNNGFNEDREEETYTEKIEVSMEDLLKEIEQDVNKVITTYEGKTLTVTTDLHDAEEISNYYYYGVESELNTNLIDMAYFYSENKRYMVTVFFIENNDDFLIINEKTLSNKKIKEKYDIDNLKEKDSITFECSELEYNEEFGEINLYVTQFINE